MKDIPPLIKPLTEILEENGIAYDTTSTDQLVLEKCPFMAHSSKKLYIDAGTGKWICHRCNRGSYNPAGLLKEILGIEYREAATILFGKKGPKSIYAKETEEDDKFNLPIKLTGMISKKNKKSNVQLPQPIQLPPTFYPLTPSDSEAWNYLKKRGLSDDLIPKLNLYHWKVARRVVFVVRLDGKIYGTMARDYTGKQDKKVLNSIGNFRSFTIWNYDTAKESEELVIAEGVFSAIKAGGITRCIALFGKVATPGQIELIKKVKAKKVYICLDVGTSEEQRKLYSQLASFFPPGSIYNIIMPPLIDNKGKTQGKEDLCKKLNRQFGVSVDYDSELDQYYLDYAEKLAILASCGIDPKKDEKKVKEAKIKSYLEKTKKNKFEAQDIQDVLWLVLHAEYRDSGDCSFEEMDQLRNEARPFTSRMFD